MSNDQETPFDFVPFVINRLCKWKNQHYKNSILSIIYDVVSNDKDNNFQTRKDTATKTGET